MTIASRLASRVSSPPNEWQPRRFALSDPADCQLLEELLDSGAVSRVHDTLMDQLAEWVKASHPSRRWQPDALNVAAVEALGGCATAQHGVWVFYPWNGVLAHVLPAEQFRFLRSVRNRYKISPAEQELLRGKTIAVVGLSVGLSAVTTMALEGIGGRFRLADFDGLGLSNLNRLRASTADLGTNKAVLAARQLYELDPYLDVQVYTDGVTEENLAHLLAPPLDVLVEECDDLAMKVRLREEARQRQIPVVMETSDRGMLDVERFDREFGRPILHGLIGNVRAAELAGLAAKDKVPFVMNLLMPSRMSVDLRASFAEIEQSIEAWPQLGSAVTIGGGILADAVRRIFLGQFTESGRYYADACSLARDGCGIELPPSGPPHAPEYCVPNVPLRPSSRRGGPVSADEARFLVEHAILAPSAGNCQPWRFEFQGDALLGFIAAERTQRFLDFRNRAAYVALGAAAENIALAAGSIGLVADIELCPDAADPLLAFRARFVRTADVSPHRLAGQIPLRVTNRKTGPRSPLTALEHAALQDAAAVHGGTLHWFEDPAQLEAIAALMGRCDRFQFLTPGGHRDTMGELRFDSESAHRTGDGLDVDSLELSATDRAALTILSDWPVMRRVREIGGGAGLEAMARRAIAGSVAVGLVSIPGEGPPAFVQGGRAVQHTWLAATQAGLAVHPWSGLPYLVARMEFGHGAGFDVQEQCWFSEIATAYRKLFPAQPQASEVMLWRIARADSPSARSLRRPVGEVFQTVDDERASTSAGSKQ